MWGRKAAAAAVRPRDWRTPPLGAWTALNPSSLDPLLIGFINHLAAISVVCVCKALRGSARGVLPPVLRAWAIRESGPPPGRAVRRSARVRDGESRARSRA